MLSYTPEQRRVMWGRCPRCNKMLFTAPPRYCRADGTPVPMLALNSVATPDALGQCVRCQGWWRVYMPAPMPPPQPAGQVYGQPPGMPGQGMPGQGGAPGMPGQLMPGQG